ncbi:MAG TPA: ATP-binding protein [Streptosporangiaceae bacterium]
MPLPEVADAGSSGDPRRTPAGTQAGVAGGQDRGSSAPASSSAPDGAGGLTGRADPPGTGNPPAADAIVTTASTEGEARVAGDGQPGTRNPAAAVAAVSTSDAPVSTSDAAVSTSDAAVSTGDAAGEQPAGPGQAGTRDVVLTLQRHLLPAGVPVFATAQLAAWHLTGAERPGDGCFDVFTLPSGTVALMTGHAAGGGPAAVAAMSQLRTVLRETLLAGAGLDEALPRMDAAVGLAPAVSGATVGIGLLDPATGTLHYASAGQPAPLVCAPAGTASALVPGGGGPLGMADGRPPPAQAVLPPGSVLVLGSGGDGGPPGRDTGKRLCGAVTAALAGEDALVAGSAGRICGSVAEGLTGPAGGDVSVLAAHRWARPAPGLFLRLPGEPAALRQLRAELAAWLDELGVSAADRVDTELAVYEAAANAIVHGRPSHGEATVTVEARLDGTGGVLVEVTDRGRWRTPGDEPDQPRPGGRGLSVISKVTGELTIAPSATGTTVVMRRALRRPVRVGPAGKAPAAGGA